MRKLFFILFLFGFSNSFAQSDSIVVIQWDKSEYKSKAINSTPPKKINHIINLSRMVILEPSYGIRINVFNKYFIQPEISYRFPMFQESYNLGYYSMLKEASSSIRNEFKFNSFMFAFTNIIKFNNEIKMEFSPFYRVKYNNNMVYYDAGCNKTSSCPTSYYSGGGINIKKYGLKTMISHELTQKFEIYYGISLFRREMIIEYDTDYSEERDNEHTIYYDELQSFEKLNSRRLGVQLGVNLIL